ncbi:MAG: PqqD family protein [bacterium]
MADETQYQLKSDVRMRRVADEGIAVQQTSGEIVAVNALGIRILELIKDNTPRAEIVGTLLAEFDVTEEQLAADIEEYLRDLIDADVIEPNQGTD